jgi:hypothetical protein
MSRSMTMAVSSSRRRLGPRFSASRRSPTPGPSLGSFRCNSTCRSPGLDAADSFDAMARDLDGNLYLAFNSEILKRTANGQLAPFAGSATVGHADGRGTAATFSSALSIAVTAGRELVVADTGSQTLRKITPDGRVRTLAGRAGSRGTRDGQSDARLEDPTIVAVDSAATVYVANDVTNNIRRVSPTGTVTTMDVQQFVEDADTAEP